MIRRTIAILLCLCAPLLADVALDVKIGFGERFRPGRWTPVFLTVTSDKPISIDADLRVANSSNTVMNIRQRIGAGPVSQTYAIYAPVSMLNDPARVTLFDAESRDLIATWPKDDPQDVNMRFGFSGEQIGFFALTTGRAPAMQNLIFNRGTGTSVVAHAATKLLPSTPIGYESIDLLFLNNPDLSTLSLDQQNAIVGWVRAGGSLVIWPGIEAIPSDSPLQSILPASPGDVVALQVSADELENAGLPKRFSGMSRRTLVPHTQTLPVSEVSVLGDAKAIVGRAGLGRVMLLPIDASTLQFDSTATFQTFWTDILRHLLYAPPKADTAGTIAAFQSESTSILGAHAVLDLIGNIPNTGSFGFGYIAVTLLGLMLIVGPIDYFVLRKIGHQPWTWATTLGWIGLFTVGAIYAGSLLRSGDLHLRTARLIDQAPDGVVAESEVALVYAPRSSFYELISHAHTWWQPVPSGNMYSEQGFALPLNVRQDTQGATPERMWIDVWSWRFLQGKRYVSGPMIVDGKLTLASPTRVTGRLTNHSPAALKNISIAQNETIFIVPQELSAGATIDFDVTQSAPTTDAPTTAPSIDYPKIFSISPQVADVVKLDNQDATKPWIVYAEMLDSAAPLTTITDITAVSAHQTFVRAVLQSNTPSSTNTKTGTKTSTTTTAKTSPNP